MQRFGLRRRYRPHGLGKTEGRGPIWVILGPGEVVRVPEGCPGMRSSGNRQVWEEDGAGQRERRLTPRFLAASSSIYKGGAGGAIWSNHDV
jgi:hypothetical protein